MSSDRTTSTEDRPRMNAAMQCNAAIFSPDGKFADATNENRRRD